jgi:hypothetical protein
MHNCHIAGHQIGRLIPMAYTAASVIAGLVLPRIEHAYFTGYVHEMSVG